MSEDNLCFEKIERLIRGIRSAEMVPGKGEVLNEVRTCLFENVTFEGVEGTTSVELPWNRYERASQAERTPWKGFKVEYLACLRKCKEANLVGTK